MQLTLVVFVLVEKKLWVTRPVSLGLAGCSSSVIAWSSLFSPAPSGPFVSASIQFREILHKYIMERGPERVQNFWTFPWIIPREMPIWSYRKLGSTPLCTSLQLYGCLSNSTKGTAVLISPPLKAEDTSHDLAVAGWTQSFNIWHLEPPPPCSWPWASRHPLPDEGEACLSPDGAWPEANQPHIHTGQSVTDTVTERIILAVPTPPRAESSFPHQRCVLGFS